MKQVSLLLLAISLLSASPVLGGHAIPSSGDYLSYCLESIKIYEGKPGDKEAANSCLGFAEGALGMQMLFSSSEQGTPFYCIPEQGVSGFDAISIWVEYLENNPQKLHSVPVTTFVLAMHEKYPCQEKVTENPK